MIYNFWVEIDEDLMSVRLGVMLTLTYVLGPWLRWRSVPSSNMFCVFFLWTPVSVNASVSYSNPCMDVFLCVCVCVLMLLCSAAADLSSFSRSSLFFFLSNTPCINTVCTNKPDTAQFNWPFISYGQALHTHRLTHTHTLVQGLFILPHF